MYWSTTQLLLLLTTTSTTTTNQFNVIIIMSTPRARLNLSYSSNDSAMDIEFSPKFGKFKWFTLKNLTHCTVESTLTQSRTMLYHHLLFASPHSGQIRLISLYDGLSLSPTFTVSQSVCLAANQHAMFDFLALTSSQPIRGRRWLPTRSIWILLSSDQKSPF